MTLFRKVFQNQGQPAIAKDAIDEEALRTALKEQETAETPLILDSFEHALRSVEDQTAEESADAELEALAGYADETENSEPPENTEEEAAETELGTSSLAGEEYDDEDSPAPMDEDINAFVGRALAAEDAKSSEFSSMDAVDVLEFETDMQEETAAEPDALENVLDDEDDAELAEDFEVSVTSDEAIEAFALSSNTDQTDETEAEASEAQHISDVAAFAQQQMAALSEPTEAASPEIDHPEVSEPNVDLSDTAALSVVPAPAAGRSGRRAGRTKTRLLGFNRSAEESTDPFGAPQEATAAPEMNKFPVGWMVIVDGPGEGHSFSIFAGASMIGRGDDQGIRLDFGDNSISRNNHAAVAYDDEENKFYIGHGGKSNIIRRNARPVLSTEELHHADLIRIGETTLRFVALCGSDFRWEHSGGRDEAGV